MERLDTRWRLIIAQFLFGAMFWFGIEQLFINSISDGGSARGYATIAFTLGLLLFDIPAGVFADKIGRKRSLLIGCVVGIVSLIVLGASKNLPTYLVGAILFGLYISLHNGAAEALLYDSLAENNQTKLYAKYQGSIYAAYMLGAAVADIAGGLIAHSLNLASAYYLSIVPIVIGFWLLLGIHEPARTKADDEPNWLSHVGAVGRLIIRNPRILAFGTQFIMVELLFLTIAEYGQVYILQFGVGTVLLGVLWSLMALSGAVGRFFAHRVQARPRLTVIVFCGVITLFAFLTKSYAIGVFCGLWAGVEVTSNIAETEIQHESSSELRATVLSAISFAGNLISVPLILLFVHLYKQHGIFHANQSFVVAIVIVLLLTLLVKPKMTDDSLATAVESAPPRII